MNIEKSIIKEVRRLTDDECENIGIPKNNLGNTRCIILKSGSILIPVSDRAMNSGGGWQGDINNIESLDNETIVSISPMSDEYIDYLDWNKNQGGKPTVIEFSNGQKIYTSGDSEGNKPGLLFEYRDGQAYEVVFS